MGRARRPADAVSADGGTYRFVACLVGVGLIGTALNLATISRLDLANVLMLYPSLMFIEGLLLGGFLYWGRRGPGRTPLGLARWAPKVLGVALGLLAVTCFSLGVGVGREVEWPAWVPRWVTLARPHVALLTLAAGLVLWMLPAQSAMVRTDVGLAEGPRIRRLRAHNACVAGLWLAAMLGAGWGVLTDGWGDDGRIAAALLAALAAAKLAGLRWRSRAADAPEGYFHDTLRRSAIIAAGAVIWFVIVPVPAHFSIQFFDYNLTLAVSQIVQGLTVVAVVVGVILAAGALANMTGWRILRAYRRRIDRDYTEFMRRVGTDPRAEVLDPPESIGAVVESALEGYRVARDTHAPAIAAWMLRSADRALDAAATGRSYFASGRPPKLRAAGPIRRLLRCLYRT
jgi:hypothetical protein